MAVRWPETGLLAALARQVQLAEAAAVEQGNDGVGAWAAGHPGCSQTWRIRHWHIQAKVKFTGLGLQASSLRGQKVNLSPEELPLVGEGEPASWEFSKKADMRQLQRLHGKRQLSININANHF